MMPLLYSVATWEEIVGAIHVYFHCFCRRPELLAHLATTVNKKT